MTRGLSLFPISVSSTAGARVRQGETNVKGRVRTVSLLAMQDGQPPGHGIDDVREGGVGVVGGDLAVDKVEVAREAGSRHGLVREEMAAFAHGERGVVDAMRDVGRLDPEKTRNGQRSTVRTRRATALSQDFGVVQLHHLPSSHPMGILPCRVPAVERIPVDAVLLEP